MSDKAPPVEIPAFCHKHNALLVHQCGFRPDDPWRTLTIIAQIAIFQGAACDEDTFKKLDGDITKIKRLGCLACWKPARFGEIIQTMGLSKEIKRIKQLGERWVKEAEAKAKNERTLQS